MARAACSVSECIENAGNTSTECTACSTGRRVTQHGLSRHTPVCPHPDGAMEKLGGGVRVGGGYLCGDSEKDGGWWTRVVLPLFFMELICSSDVRATSLIVIFR